MAEGDSNCHRSPRKNGDQYPNAFCIPGLAWSSLEKLSISLDRI